MLARARLLKYPFPLAYYELIAVATGFPGICHDTGFALVAPAVLPHLRQTAR